MANSITDVFTAIQNGVTALNNFGKQLNGSLLNISGQLANRVISIAGNHGVFTLNAATGITNTVNDIELIQGSSSQFGAVKVDGTTIAAAAGVISVVPTQAALVLLNTITASNSASMQDTTSFTSTYSSYELVFQNVVPVSGANTLGMQFFISGVLSGASSYYTVGVVSASNGTTGTTAALNISSPATASILLTYPALFANVNNGMNGSLRINIPSSTTLFKSVWGEFTIWDTSTILLIVSISGSYIGSTGPVTGFSCSLGAGNISSGVIKVYGIV